MIEEAKYKFYKDDELESKLQFERDLNQIKVICRERWPELDIMMNHKLKEQRNKEIRKRQRR